MNNGRAGCTTCNNEFRVFWRFLAEYIATFDWILSDDKRPSTADGRTERRAYLRAGINEQNTDNLDKTGRDKSVFKATNRAEPGSKLMSWNIFEKRKDQVRQERMDKRKEEKRRKIDSLFDDAEESTNNLNKIINEIKQHKHG